MADQNRRGGTIMRKFVALLIIVTILVLSVMTVANAAGPRTCELKVHGPNHADKPLAECKTDGLFGVHYGKVSQGDPGASFAVLNHKRYFGYETYAQISFRRNSSASLEMGNSGIENSKIAKCDVPAFGTGIAAGGWGQVRCKECGVYSDPERVNATTKYW
jgi:hypothetical protein